MDGDGAMSDQDDPTKRVLTKKEKERQKKEREKVSFGRFLYSHVELTLFQMRKKAEAEAKKAEMTPDAASSTKAVSPTKQLLGPKGTEPLPVAAPAPAPAPPDDDEYSREAQEKSVKRKKPAPAKKQTKKEPPKKKTGGLPTLRTTTEPPKGTAKEAKQK